LQPLISSVVELLGRFCCACACKWIILECGHGNLQNLAAYLPFCVSTFCATENMPPPQKKKLGPIHLYIAIYISVFPLNNFYRRICRGLSSKKRKKKIEAFRKAFGKIGQLRVFLPNVPLVALTATSDKVVKNNLNKALFMQHPLRINMSPNKDNIRISVTKIDSLSKFNWLIKELVEERKATLFTIIFCNTLHDIARLLTFFLMSLGKEIYIEGDGSISGNCLLGVFHSGVFQEMKDTINTSFKDLQGATRVVFATSSLGMGVHYPEVEYIIHYGPARRIISQLQEAGRAGRNGIQAHNIIYYEGRHLIHCDKSVTTTLKSNSCLRVAMYSAFDENIAPLLPLHLCCSNCYKHCDCGDCPVFEFEEFCEKQVDDSSPTRVVSDEDRSDFEEALHE
jgi:hypothetical protein